MISEVLHKPQALRFLLLPSPPPIPYTHWLLPFPLQTPLETGVTSQTGLMIRLQDTDSGTFSAERGLRAVKCPLGSGMHLAVAPFPALSHADEVESWPKACFPYHSALPCSLSTAELKPICSLRYFRPRIVKQLHFSLQSLSPPSLCSSVPLLLRM